MMMTGTIAKTATTTAGTGALSTEKRTTSKPCGAVPTANGRESIKTESTNQITSSSTVPTASTMAVLAASDAVQETTCQRNMELTTPCMFSRMTVVEHAQSLHLSTGGE